MKPRTVFLFAAGAVIDWKGPKTTDLTELVLKSGFKTKNSNITNTQFIYSRLLSKTNKEKINFETIIDAIEELIIFYSKNSINLVNPFFKCDFDEDDFFNYGSNLIEEPPNLINDKLTEQQKYLVKLLLNLLTNVNRRISNYTEGKDVIFIEENKEINSLFVNWVKNKEDTTLRLYTLNYDNLFKVLLEKEGISIFDGFFKQPNTSLSGRKTDFNKLLTNFDSHIHYNLHGSAYWKVLYNEHINAPFSPLITQNNTISLSTDSRATITELEKGKSLILTNIITGYKKIQRTSFPPFK